MKYFFANTRLTIVLLGLLITSAPASAEDGYELWLRYKKITDNRLLATYRNSISAIHIIGESRTLLAAKEELQNGLKGLLGTDIASKNVLKNGSLLAGTPSQSAIIRQLIKKDELSSAGNEGFIIRSANYQGKKLIIITANNDIGVLYGCFHFLRLLQTHQSISKLKSYPFLL